MFVTHAIIGILAPFPPPLHYVGMLRTVGVTCTVSSVASRAASAEQDARQNEQPNDLPHRISLPSTRD